MKRISDFARLPARPAGEPDGQGLRIADCVSMCDARCVMCVPRLIAQSSLLYAHRSLLRAHRSLLIALCSLLFALSSSLNAQQTDEVRAAITRVDKGQTEDVKKELPDLIAKYQNTAEILYLQGRLASDGLEAVKFYQSVVDNFPKSELADDALYHIYQYYYSLGLYRTADLKMQQLKKEYPNSYYVTGKQEETLPEQEEAPVKLPSKETVVAVDTSESVETKPEVTTSPAIPPRAPEPYTLQVGAFSTAANAEKQKNFFEELGYNVEITNKMRSGRSLYLVWVGSFPTKEEALREERMIKAKYKIESIIVERY